MRALASVLAVLLCAAAVATGQAAGQSAQEATQQNAQQNARQSSSQQSSTQESARPVASRDDDMDGGALIVEGETTRDVFGMGRTVVVRGNVRHGVMAFGGDVIVEGRVEGDVASLGGSVIQREGSWIGGDVWVVGGAYHHGKNAPGRNPASSTVMYAGYERELREAARNPASILAPRWTLTSLGVRVLSVLFWFIVSLALTAMTPGAISRAAARLQLTSLRVAVIGFVGSLVISVGVPVSLYVLPPVLGTFVLALAALLYVVAYPFGRVAVHVATGRWLQRVLLSERSRSESVALLLGALFWALILSVPYVWAFAFAALVVISLGLALTARYSINWKSHAKA
ncbi:MAG: hypothetical protein QOE33_792 [Acidobacteriota bacterium]|nr:hypothetical protein [Acidobacteriota bacterium]